MKKKQPKILTKLGLTKGKIADCMQVVEMHREILSEQGLHPEQVSTRKNFQFTAKYNRLGYDMLAHFSSKISEHNKKIVKANEPLLDKLEEESLGGVELPMGKYNRFKRLGRKYKYGTKRNTAEDEADRKQVRTSTSTSKRD